MFDEYKLTVDRIRKCFRNSGPLVKERRNRVIRHFANVCRTMITVLQSGIFHDKVPEGLLSNLITESGKEQDVISDEFDGE